MATTSPPASPSKRPGLLRSLVTGIDEPVDRDAHAQRWHRAPAGPRSPNSPPAASNLPAALAATGARESKVRSLVQGWEQASLGARSRPYEVLAPAPASPYRTTFEPRDIRAGGAVTGDRPALRVNSNHLVYADEATSPRRGTSPTVPAAYFQMQAAKRTVDAMPAKFDPQQQRRPVQPGKENHRPSPGSGTTAATPPRLPQLNMAPLLSASTMSARTDLTADTDTGTAVTVETMATRSSGSTHAASLLTTPVVEAFADEHAHPTQAASRGQEAKRFSTFSRTATQVRDQQDLRSGPPPFARPQSSGDTTPEPSRPVLQHRPVSSFIEALPPRPTAPASAHSAFVTSPNSATSSSAQHSQERPACYSPLPLDCALPLTPVSRSVPNAPPAPSSRRRPRSSSAGEGARPAGIMQLDSERAARPAETAQEKASRVDAEFARLLDTMQLPDQTVRTRMLGLALPLKEEMLRTASSASPSLKVPSRASHQRGRSMNTVGGFSSFAAAGSAGDRNGRPDDVPSSGFKSFLRKAKSNSSLRSQNAHDSATTAAVSTLAAVPSGRTRSKSRSRATSTSSVFRGLGKSSGAGAGAVSSDLAGFEGEGPTYWASRLRTGTTDTLQVKELGRLRGRLRNESPAWIGEFVTHGGYVGLLARLKDLLEKEWREEQHDDQVLHEVLRCFKALTMTNVGKRTLATYSPTPFLPLTALLFSEKRPGDLPCRQILVELVHALFQICPSTCDTLPIAAWSDATVSLDPPVSRSSPVLGSPGSFASSSASSYENGTGSGGVRRYTRRAKMGDDDDEENLGLGGRRNSLEREEIPTPDRVQRAHRFVVSLMRGPPDEDEEAKVDFMKRAHRERVYKVWVKEIADCVRDYFWCVRFPGLDPPRDVLTPPNLDAWGLPFSPSQGVLPRQQPVLDARADRCRSGRGPESAERDDWRRRVRGDGLLYGSPSPDQRDREDVSVDRGGVCVPRAVVPEWLRAGPLYPASRIAGVLPSAAPRDEPVHLARAGSAVQPRPAHPRVPGPAVPPPRGTDGPARSRAEASPLEVGGAAARSRLLRAPPCISSSLYRVRSRVEKFAPPFVPQVQFTSVAQLAFFSLSPYLPTCLHCSPSCI